MLVPLPGIALMPRFAILDLMASAKFGDLLRVRALVGINFDISDFSVIVFDDLGFVSRVAVVHLDAFHDTSAVLSRDATAFLGELSFRLEGSPGSTGFAVSERLAVERSMSKDVA